MISKPENAKHIADQRPIVSSSAPCGTMDSEVNGVPLWFDGGSIYAEQWRFTFGTDPKKKTPLLVEANDYAPDDYDDWNGTPMHTALASDGSGILFPGDYDKDHDTVVELDPTKDGVLHTYALAKGVSSTDMAYTHAETHVVTVGLDSDEYLLQVFDRGTGTLRRGQRLIGRAPRERSGASSRQQPRLKAGSEGAVFVWCGTTGR